MNIVVDSCCDFTDKLKKEKEIEVSYVPFGLQLGADLFVDDANLDLDQYMDRMSKSEVGVKTAAPSPESFYEQYKQDGGVFVVTISQHLSASYNNALVAKQMYIDDVGEKFIHVFDSLSASVGETLIALKINEFLKNAMPETDIVTNVTSFIKEMRTYFILERYDNLVKNGRMNAYVAKVASMLSIKPICAGVEGRTEMIDKARGTQKAMKKLIDKIVNDTVDFENRIMAIAHVKCMDKAIWFRDEVMKSVNFKEIIILETGGLSSTYADQDGLIIAY